MTNWKYWKDHRLAKHQAVIIIITLIITIIVGFTAVDEEKNQTVGAQVLNWNAIKSLGPGDINDEANKDLTFINNYLNDQDVSMPWNWYPFYLFHFQLWQTGDSGYDYTLYTTTAYTGWPCQYIFKYQVHGSETTSNVYEFWEVAPVAFILDWAAFYLILSFIALCYYILDIKVFSQQGKKGSSGIKFK